jgi:type IV secretion system protein VirD4
VKPNDLFKVYQAEAVDEPVIGEDEDIHNYDDVDDPDVFA